MDYKNIDNQSRTKEKKKNFLFEQKFRNLLSCGNYKKLREILENSKEPYNKIWSMLESYEMNFLASSQYIEDSSEEKIKFSHMLLKARNNLQIGNYKASEEILKIIQKDPSFFLVATLDLIGLNIRRQEYLEAWRLLNSINEKELKDKKLAYRRLKIYLELYLGMLKVRDESDFSHYYFIYRFFEESNASLIRHLWRHVLNGNKDTGFFPSIDLELFIKEIEEMITIINASYDQFDADIYKIRLDHNIGLYKGIETCDLQIITLPKKQKIITMYPVSYSDKFDNEGNVKSSKIRYRRAKGE